MEWWSGGMGGAPRACDLGMRNGDLAEARWHKGTEAQGHKGIKQRSFQSLDPASPEQDRFANRNL